MGAESDVLAGAGGLRLGLIEALGEIVAQRKQAVGEVDVLDDDVGILELQLGVGEVPDRMHAAGADLLGDLVGHGLRHAEHRHIGPDGRDALLELAEIVNRDAVDLAADDVGVDVKGGLEIVAVLLEAEILDQRAADVADADDL